MRSYFFYFTVVIGLLSCKNEKKEPSSPQVPVQETAETQTDSLKEYHSEKWHFSLKYPSSYEVAEGELPASAPVVNIYAPGDESDPPLAIHENAKASYIAFLPEGYGVDAPAGTRRSFEEWEGNLPLSFEIDPVHSTIYLLDSGEPWAASLRFDTSPPGWKDHGSIFVHFAVADFEAACFDGDSKEAKAMEACDPLVGDEVKYSGKVDPDSKEALYTVLENIRLTSEGNSQEREISDLIQVEKPLPHDEIQSPLRITGSARGSWYFEGEAPVKLVDKDTNTLARGSLKAQGDWMKEDFVPFETDLSFQSPGNERGYLVFNRSNASGKPEHDRVYRIPVVFPPKK